MQRGETDPAVQRDQGRVPFDVVPNSDYRVDQSADEKAVRRSRESNLDGQARRQSKDEESGITAVGDDNVNEKEFEVTWDGDDDPMNPRSMPYARKWIIVIIVSASSLCVYVVFSSLFRRNSTSRPCSAWHFVSPPALADPPPSSETIESDCPYE